MVVRQKVLAHLKKTRTASVCEIARALKMSAPNVRHHLGILTSDGRLEVTSTHQRGGRGRPEKIYSLSQSALGDNLSVLADVLLDGKVNMEKIGKQIAESRNLIGFTGQPMTKRLALLVEKLNEMHYQARWEAGAAGPRVIFGRCPFAKIIENHPELCKMDMAMLSASLGNSAMPMQKNEAGIRGLCPFIFQVS